jgi:hypothetical protein
MNEDQKETPGVGLGLNGELEPSTVVHGVNGNGTITFDDFPQGASSPLDYCRGVRVTTDAQPLPRWLTNKLRRHDAGSAPLSMLAWLAQAAFWTFAIIELLSHHH